MTSEGRLPVQQQAEYLGQVRRALARAPDEVREDAAAYASRLLEHGLPVLFDVGHLGAVTGVPPQVIGTIRQHPQPFYSRFVIPKRSGGSREIAAPTPALRRLQDWIHRYLAPKMRVHECCHGFVRGRSIVSNAAPHEAATKLLKFDIRDFFGSVPRRRVFRAFRRLGYSSEMADLLTSLTTLDGSLPQGAPTSPALANDAAFGMDVRLGAFATRHRLAYTRYADDLTFSGEVSGRSVRRTVELIMRAEGFGPNEKKLRYVSGSERQSVTGIVVNEKLNWPRTLRRWLRQEIYYLEKHGVDHHLAKRQRDHLGGYKDFIYGHVYALKMVRPDDATSYLERLDVLEWAY